MKKPPNKAKFDAKKAAVLGAKSDVAKIVNTRFEAAFKPHKKFMKLAKRCQDFVEGQQWDADALQEMEAARRPALTINLTMSVVNAMFSAYEEVEAELAVKPRSMSAATVSEILNRIIKTVMIEEGYDEAEADMFLDALITGRGWVRLEMSTERDPLGAIQVTLEDYNSVVLSTDAAQYDPDTWPEIFYIDWFTRADIKEEFGEEAAELLDYSYAHNSTQSYFDARRMFGEEDREEAMAADEQTFSEAPVVTREYFEWADAYVFMDDTTTDYEVRPATEFESLEEATALAAENNLSLYETRIKRVRIVRISGDHVLHDDWSPYKHYTMIPLFCYFSRGRTSGVVQQIISPQEQLNKGESQELHIVNATSNGGWTVEEDSLVNMDEEELEKNGAKAGLVLVHRRGTNAPGKIQPNQIPSGISNLGQKAAGYVRQVSGVNDAMLGITKTNDSGSLLEGKQRTGSALLTRIFSNLTRTQKILARNILDIIQEYYTEPRVFRIATSDGKKEEELMVNRMDAAGRIVNDLSIGSYDIVVTTQPKKEVKDDYEFEKLLRMREANINIPSYLLAEKVDIEDRAEVVALLRRQDGLDKTPEEQQIDQLRNQIAIEDLQIELAKKKAEVGKLHSEAQLNMAHAQDILVGQNKRHALSIIADQESDMRNSKLRVSLAELSSDTAITKQLLNDAQKSQQTKPNPAEKKAAE